MKRLLFGIFAHPDDEAFGPSATLIKEATSGTKVHLICVTNGQNGMNPDKVPDLGAKRLKEWQAAGKLIGASSQHALGFEDGTLCNNMYFDIADQITEIVHRAVAAHDQCELSFMTFDPNGFTGHLDHIAVSSITTYVFYKLKAIPPANCTIHELVYYCMPRAFAPEPSVDFVYMPPGRPDDFINRRVSVADLFEQKVKIMQAHHSQRKDAEAMLARGSEFHRTDHFCVVDR